MSVIAEARNLAAEIVEIEGKLITTDKDAAALEFASDCKLGLTLAHLIIEGYVTRVDEKALALLDNAVNRGRTIANRPAAPFDAEAAGPIYPVGTELMVCRNDYPDVPEHMIVTKAEFDGDFWQYRFTAMSAQGSIYVEEGDLRYNIVEFCPDEV